MDLRSGKSVWQLFYHTNNYTTVVLLYQDNNNNNNNNMLTLCMEMNILNNTERMATIS